MKWQSWSKAAFAKAKKEGKPILLSIGAVWCHWCHTMKKETYSKPALIKHITANFIPVWVDADEHPEINARYNIGGYPSTLILAEDGEPVFGATYVPPEGMLQFLKDGKKQLKTYTPREKKPLKIPPRDTSSEEIYRQIVTFFDQANGGFGLEPKFPEHDILEYLLWRVYSLRDKASAAMLKKAFDAMLQGELFDSAGGGFFRYATERDWTIPHFEKTLEDNARLLSAFFHAHKLFSKDEYLTAVNKTMFFVMTTLYDHRSGLFYGSQVADEEFCNLAYDERLKKKAPFIDKRFFVDQNATMALTLFELARSDPEYARGGLRILDTICKRLEGGVPHELGKKTFLLRDTVYLLTALLQAHALTKNDGWRLRAIMVAKHMTEFHDDERGGFFDVVPRKSALGRLAQPRKPVQENAVAALALNALAHLTQEKKYAVMGLQALKATSMQASVLGPRAALFALAKSTMKV